MRHFIPGLLALLVLLPVQATTPQEGSFEPSDTVELSPEIRDVIEGYPGVRLHRDGGSVLTFYGAPMTDATSPEAAVDAWLEAHGGAILGPGSELVLEGVQEIALGRYTLFSLSQVLDGLAVENGIVRILVLNDWPYRVVYVASRLARWPHGGFSPVEIPAGEAVETMRATESFAHLQSWREPELVVFYEEADVSLEEPVLAWKYLAQLGEGPESEAYTFFVDAVSGTLVYLRDEIYHVDVNGHVDGLATPGTFPDTSSNPPVSFDLPEGRAAILGGNSAFADRNGDFVISHGGSSPVTVAADLIAPWVVVLNDQGGELHLEEAVTPPGPANFSFNTSPSQFTTAQVNGFIHTVDTHNFMKDRVPGFTAIDMQITCNVNLASTCNAFYSSADHSINFYSEGGGCVNTAYSSVVAHEYGHFVVNRLGLAQGAFGEGYGDVIGMLQFDDPILGRDFRGPGTNVRDPVSENLQYPCSGEIHFCGMLLGGCWWDIRDQLGMTQGSGPGLTIAQQLFADWSLITVGGIGDNSAHPQTAIEVLTVDDDDGNINNGTPHYNEICTAFASHSIDCPDLPEIVFTYPEGLPGTLVPNQPTVIRVDIVGNTEDPVAGTETLWYRINGGAWLSDLLVEIGPEQYEGTLPAGSCFDEFDYYFATDSTSGATVTDPGDAPTTTYKARVVTGVLTAFADDFETDQGWTVQNVTLTDGPWERGIPAGDGSRGDPLTDGDGSGRCYLTDNVAGNSDVDGGPTRLISPLLDFSSGDGTISYWYWMYNDDGDDSMIVEVSGNAGGSWTEVTRYTGGAGGWKQESFAVGDFVTPSSQVQVRFSIADEPNNSVTEGGIDGVVAEQFDCDAFIDCNDNGIPDDLDIINGTSQDCNGNGVPDECDIDDGTSADCNGNGVPDECDIAGGTSEDCNANGIPDECEIAGNDCNGNGVLDECDIASGTSQDCNGNLIPDECDIAGGTSEDCNANGIPDECEIAGNDCNGNGVLDECDIASGTSQDCNGNLIPDECDIAGGTSEDCNANGIPDECEIAGNDCNGNGVLDECDIASGTSQDCNGNLIPDECDIAGGTSEDCNANGIPDECEIAGNDCNGNGVLDECDIASGTSQDCNGNLIPDECDIAGGTSEDCNANGIPDECEIAGNDCNGNGVLDECDIASGTSQDCNGNLIPDECDIAGGTSEDCNANGIPDECEIAGNDCNGNGVLDECDIASGTSQDCNGNLIPDECDIAGGTSEDCNANGIPDECEIAGNDCNGNGVLDECDIASGTSQDCNGNLIPDECDIAGGTSEDCNANGIPDECEIAGNDCNGNGVLDECDIASGTSQDCNGNLIPDECDIAGGTSEDCNANGIPDECEIAGNDCNGNGVLDECDIASGTSEDENENGIPDECEPVIALCGPGAVNAGCGTRTDILRVNGDTGGIDRTLEIGIDTPVSFVLEESPGNQGDGFPTKACIYIWTSEPAESDVVIVPKGLGKMCFGPWMLRTRDPVAIFNSIGVPSKLGPHDAPTPPPVVPDGGNLEFLSLPGGVGMAVDLTMQGLVEDDCTQGTKPYSVTNGLLLRVQ